MDQQYRGYLRLGDELLNLNQVLFLDVSEGQSPTVTLTFQGGIVKTIKTNTMNDFVWSAIQTACDYQSPG